MTPEAIRYGNSPENKNSRVTIETISKRVEQISIDKSTPEANATVTNSHRYSASVPISLYREIAAELASAKTKLSALSDENGRLKHQNQLLKREVQYLSRSTPTRKNINRSFVIEPQKPQNPVVRERVAEGQLAEKLADEQPFTISDLPEVEKFVSKGEEPAWIAETGQNFPIESQSNRGVNGWLLALAIILIVATAFTAGFLLVRPLIGESGNRK
jgi:hypothetical protein